MINLHIYETKMRAITGSNNNSESNNNDSRNNNGNLRQTTAAAATVNNNQACAWVAIAKGVRRSRGRERSEGVSLQRCNWRNNNLKLKL